MLKRCSVVAAIGLCLGLFVWGTASARPPQDINNPQQYTRIGSSGLGHQHSLLTSMRPVLTSTGGWVSAEDLWLFEFGSIANISCTAQAVFCWSQTATITLAATGHMIDANAQEGARARGAGHCFEVEAGGSVAKMLNRNEFATPTDPSTGQPNVGRRVGWCSGRTQTANWPCRVAGDCPWPGTTTCNTSVTSITDFWNPPQTNIKGAFLLSIAPVATTCYVSEEH